MSRSSGFGAVRVLALAVVLWSAASAACAGTVEFGGKLNDPGNTALVGSGAWAPSAPLADFTDDYVIANNVALYSLTVTAAGNVQFVSSGYAAGGVDPYFTLFSGTGAGATFLDSNYYSPGGDFSITDSLAAGHYTVAIGVFDNMSFAENWGLPLTLADGFIGLGEPYALGNYAYKLTVTGPVVPEPTSSTLMLTGLAAAWLAIARRRRSGFARPARVVAGLAD